MLSPIENESFCRLSLSGIIVGRLTEWEMEAEEAEEASPWFGFPTALPLVLGLELVG